MIIAVVDFKKCAACAHCEVIKVCNTRAIIKIDADEPAVIDQSLCHGCADCVEPCPYDAISVVEI